jgi:hypothetical protein
VGSLVAAGYSSAELAELMAALDYTKFRDGDVLDHLGVFGKASPSSSSKASTRATTSSAGWVSSSHTRA